MEPRSVSLFSSVNAEGTLTLALTGRLDVFTTGSVWREAMEAVRQASPSHVAIDAAELEYLDAAGVSLLLELQLRQIRMNGRFEITGLKKEFRHLVDPFEPRDFMDVACEEGLPVGLPVQLGRALLGILNDLHVLVSFTGELATALFRALGKPRSIRWKDALLAAEKAGANALPIVALISFLVGLIMAFQGVIPMRQFGVEIYVSDLIALSVLRELGPLMTAIILAGRSGSAFAAEIGTMKVNEEIDALTTMGLDPVRFLVVTRVIAAIVVTPLLTLFANGIGLIGGSIPLLTMGYPLITYVNHVLSSVTHVDLLGGLAKSLAFGMAIASIGCLQGLRTRTGASAVGDSATRAVVSGLILIVVIDGLFAVVYYYLGI